MTPVTVKLTRGQLDYLAEAVVARLTAVPSICAAMPLADVRAAQAVDAVAKHGKFRRQDILGPGRKMPGTFGRMAAMYLMRQAWGIPYGEIARAFGKKDHGTAMAACQTISDRVALEPETQRWIEAAAADLATSHASDGRGGQ